VLLNAAAALVAVDPTDEPLEGQIGAGLARAAEAVDSGAAAALLDTWVRTSQALASP
jgi:anthranilate phosphoribosyltransferase